MLWKKKDEILTVASQIIDKVSSMFYFIVVPLKTWVKKEILC